MPGTRVIFFQEKPGAVPVLDWLRELLDRGEKKAYAKCLALIHRLAEEGQDLRRPTSAPLRDGIHELRGKDRKVNLPILYAFVGSGVVILVHALKKQGAEVPADEIDRAIRRVSSYRKDPERHTYQREQSDDQDE